MSRTPKCTQEMMIINSNLVGLLVGHLTVVEGGKKYSPVDTALLVGLGESHLAQL